MTNLQESKLNFQSLTEKINIFFTEKSKKLSAETLNWVGILLLHGATVPNLLALMAGITDNPPPVDMVLLVWAGLIMFFIKSALQKDLLNMLTIGFGFVLQALLMMLIFFK
jgi:hypothetical protein